SSSVPHLSLTKPRLSARTHREPHLLQRRHCNRLAHIHRRARYGTKRPRQTQTWIRGPRSVLFPPLLLLPQRI
ncbi:hypothetical protein CH063_15682, partial [Colletotrichum higginsianum]